MRWTTVCSLYFSTLICSNSIYNIRSGSLFGTETHLAPPEPNIQEEHPAEVTTIQHRQTTLIFPEALPESPHSPDFESMNR